jgi:hypothetical protein
MLCHQTEDLTSDEIMPARVIGKNPKPAALIVGFDDATAETIGKLFAVHRVIDLVHEVEQKEWDVLITTRSALGAEYHLYVIGIGCEAYAPPGRAELPSSFGPYHHDIPKLAPGARPLPPGARPAPHSARPANGVQWTGDSKARALQIPENLQASIEQLIVTKLVPLAQSQEAHQWLEPKGVLEPFLTTLLYEYLAGRFRRPGAKSECWCFPHYAVDIAPGIVKVALKEWQQRDPETFPVVNWAKEAMWRTPSENRIAGKLDELTAQRTAILADLDERQEQLEAELVGARRSTDAHERLLLTARSHDLVNAVTNAFSDLGFDVTNMDEVYPEGDRREDLQVTASDLPNWIALVEVRGYRGGASVGDLIRIERFRTRYVQDHGKAPHAVWYLANQFIEDDPGTRPPILVTNEHELGVFAEGGGLAIDTADLFRLWMAVKHQRLAAEEARSRLLQGRGRFTFQDEP